MIRELLFGKLIRAEVEKKVDIYYNSETHQIRTKEALAHIFNDFMLDKSLSGQSGILPWDYHRALIVEDVTNAVNEKQFRPAKAKLDEMINSEETIIRLVDEINKRQPK